MKKKITFLFAALALVLLPNGIASAETGENIELNYVYNGDYYYADEYVNTPAFDVYLEYQPTLVSNGETITVYNKLINYSNSNENLFYQVGYDPDIMTYRGWDGAYGGENPYRIEIIADGYGNDDDYYVTVKYQDLGANDSGASNIYFEWQHGSNRYYWRNMGLNGSVSGQQFAVGQWAHMNAQMAYSDDAVIMN